MPSEDSRALTLCTFALLRRSFEPKRNEFEANQSRARTLQTIKAVLMALDQIIKGTCLTLDVIDMK